VAKSRIYQAVGEAIHIRRRRLRMSQERLAEKADLHRNYIGEVERADKQVTLETLAKIAKALGVRVRDLVEDI
jgi:transcriptional regulator with XRE-family HTH domain